MKIALPQDRATLTDKDARTTPDFYRWMNGVTNAVNKLPADPTASLTKIATVLGSPDGTVPNIPARAGVSLMQGAGIFVNGLGTALDPWIINLAPAPDIGGGILQKTLFDSYGRRQGTSAATTSDLAEGSNLYFTAARAAAALVFNRIDGNGDIRIDGNGDLRISS